MSPRAGAVTPSGARGCGARSGSAVQPDPATRGEATRWLGGEGHQGENRRDWVGVTELGRVLGGQLGKTNRVLRGTGVGTISHSAGRRASSTPSTPLHLPTLVSRKSRKSLQTSSHFRSASPPVPRSSPLATLTYGLRKHRQKGELRLRLRT